MDDLILNLPFSDNDIDKENYTMSLLSRCAQSDIISTAEIVKIKSDINEAFTETAAQFTKRQSSTISRKRAELIYSSVLYWSDIYFLSLDSLEKSVKSLKSCPMKYILDFGRELILKIHHKNSEIYKKVLDSRLDIDCYEYNYVLDHSFAEYAKGYSARFDARSCCASIDYPLLNCPAYSLSSQGAMYINEYYSKLLFENEFCRLFDHDKLISVLVAYGHIYKSNYTEILFNIAEVTANNLFANTLLGRNNYEIVLSSYDIKSLRNMCSVLSEETVCNKLRDLFSDYKIKFQNDSVYRYIIDYIPVFSSNLCRHASSYSSLYRFLAVSMDGI